MVVPGELVLVDQSPNHTYTAGEQADDASEETPIQPVLRRPFPVEIYQLQSGHASARCVAPGEGPQQFVT